MMQNPEGPRTIVVATDFSDNAAAAVAHAGEIARQHGARLVLVHAVAAMTPAAPEFIPVPPAFYEELRERARAELEKEVASLRRTGLLVDSLLVAEPAAEGVLEAAADRSADLIVVGARGTTRWQRLLLGSTAARLVRHAPCPVVMVPSSGVVRQGPMRVALAATDFSEDATSAAEAAVRMLGAGGPGRRLVLHHVYRYPPAIAVCEGPALIDIIAGTHDSALSELGALAAKMEAPGVAIETCAEPGEPAEAILAKAKAIGADLIAIGTHGRSRLKRLFLGRAAERVLPAAPCPILTAHHRSRSGETPADEGVEPCA
jgi:nucleotide-binding universal stress UspA family protein